MNILLTRSFLDRSSLAELLPFVISKRRGTSCSRPCTSPLMRLPCTLTLIATFLPSSKKALKKLNPIRLVKPKPRRLTRVGPYGYRMAHPHPAPSSEARGKKLLSPAYVPADAPMRTDALTIIPSFQEERTQENKPHQISQAETQAAIKNKLLRRPHGPSAPCTLGCSSRRRVGARTDQNAPRLECRAFVCAFGLSCCKWGRL